MARTRERVPRTRSETATQVLSGVLVGALAVYVAALVLKGIAFGFVVLLLGIAYLARKRPRVGPFASGVAFSGLAGFAVLLLIVALGHEIV